MNKPKLYLIIRGYLYNPKRKDIHRNEPAGVNFMKNYKSYLKLVNLLQQKYDLKLYFSSYDSTPKEIIDFIKSKFDSANFLFTSNNQSNQWTTLISALQELNTYKPELTMTLRSDMILTNKFIERMVDFNYIDNHLYILCREGISYQKHIKKYSIAYGNTIDAFHCFNNNIFDKFLKYVIYVCDPKNYIKTVKFPNGSPPHLHKIHKAILSQSIIENPLEPCWSVRNCHEYFTIENFT